MKKVIACLLIAIMCLGSIAVPAAHAEKGGVISFFAGCCLGIRVGTQYNEGVDIHWREWSTLIPVVGLVVGIWNGVDCAMGMTGHEFAEKYGVNWY